MKDHKVISLRAVSKTAFVLRFTRENKEFVPGLHISVGLPGSESRPYSIYSGAESDYLEILVKEVKNGVVTPLLSNLLPGDKVKVGEPRGYFCLPDDYKGEKVCLIATGTGIAPYHSFIKSIPKINFHLYHGVRDLNETYDLDCYSRSSVTVCTSRSNDGDIVGRVTEAIKCLNVEDYSLFYVCGSYEMVDDVYEILETKGVYREQIKTEGYF